MRRIGIVFLLHFFYETIMNSRLALFRCQRLMDFAQIWVILKAESCWAALGGDGAGAGDEAGDPRPGIF